MAEKQELWLVELLISNYMGVSAFDRTYQPGGGMEIIGGDNGQGKTSVLNALYAALGGQRHKVPVPIKIGHEKAEVVITFSNGWKLIRRWRQGKLNADGVPGEAVHDVKLVTADGANAPSVQAWLDSLGVERFDPVAFGEMKPKEQAEALQDAIMDPDRRAARAAAFKSRKELYEERTLVNRDKDTCEKRVTAIVFHKDAPAEEVPTNHFAELQAKHSAEMKKRGDATRATDQAQSSLENAKRFLADQSGLVKRLEAQLEAAVKSREEAMVKVEDAETALERAKANEAELGPIPELDVAAQIAQAQAINDKVRANKSRAALLEEFKAHQSKSTELTKQIEAIDMGLAGGIAAALQASPLAALGVAFTEDGVTLNGLPYKQASESEQLLTALAIALAKNPKLKVLAVDKGESIGKAKRETMRQWAEANRVQIIMTSVGLDGATVVMESGEAHEPVAVGERALF